MKTDSRLHWEHRRNASKEVMPRNRRILPEDSPGGFSLPRQTPIVRSSTDAPSSEPDLPIRRAQDEIAAGDPSMPIDLGFSESILELWPVREAFLFSSLMCDPDPATWRAWFAYRQPHGDQGALGLLHEMHLPISNSWPRARMPSRAPRFYNCSKSHEPSPVAKGVVTSGTELQDSCSFATLRTGPLLSRKISLHPCLLRSSGQAQTQKKHKPPRTTLRF
jgi:hypothetical protein